jgi:hypothetical protein
VAAQTGFDAIAVLWRHVDEFWLGMTFDAPSP